MTIDPALLDRGEVVLWSGKPVAWRHATMNWFSSIFGLVFMAGPASQLPTELQKAGPTKFIIPVFMLAGLAFFLTPMWNWLRARQTTYVLTSKRAITVVSGPLKKVSSVPLDGIRFVEINQRSSDCGDVFFREIASKTSEGQQIIREGFIAVPDAEKVEKLLRTALDKRSIGTKNEI